MSANISISNLKNYSPITLANNVAVYDANAKKYISIIDSQNLLREDLESNFAHLYEGIEDQEAVTLKTLADSIENLETGSQDYLENGIIKETYDSSNDVKHISLGYLNISKDEDYSSRVDNETPNIHYDVNPSILTMNAGAFKIESGVYHIGPLYDSSLSDTKLYSNAEEFINSLSAKMDSELDDLDVDESLLYSCATDDDLKKNLGDYSIGSISMTAKGVNIKSFVSNDDEDMTVQVKYPITSLDLSSDGIYLAGKNFQNGNEILGIFDDEGLTTKRAFVENGMYFYSKNDGEDSYKCNFSWSLSSNGNLKLAKSEYSLSKKFEKGGIL